MGLERWWREQREGLSEKSTVVRTSLVHGGTVDSLGSLVGRHAKRGVGGEP